MNWPVECSAARGNYCKDLLNVQNHPGPCIGEARENSVRPAGKWHCMRREAFVGSARLIHLSFLPALGAVFTSSVLTAEPKPLQRLDVNTFYFEDTQQAHFHGSLNGVSQEQMLNFKKLHCILIWVLTPKWQGHHVCSLISFAHVCACDTGLSKKGSGQWPLPGSKWYHLGKCFKICVVCLLTLYLFFFSSFKLGPSATTKWNHSYGSLSVSLSSDDPAMINTGTTSETAKSSHFLKSNYSSIYLRWHWVFTAALDFL